MKKFFIENRLVIIIVSIMILLPPAVGVWTHFEFQSIYAGEFSPRKWDWYPRLRHHMVGDMARKIRIRELSKKEILSILGTNAAHVYETEIIYIVDKGLFLYFEQYNIKFTEDGEEVISVWRSSHS